MEWVELLKNKYSNPAGFVWTWTYLLGKTTRNQLILKAVEEIIEGEEGDEPHPMKRYYVKRSGKDFWDTFLALTDNDSCEEDYDTRLSSEDRATIIKQVKILDAKLSGKLEQLEKCKIEHEREEEERERAEKVFYKKTIGIIESLFSKYAKEATWEGIPHGLGGSIIRPVGKRIITEFTENYYKNHRKLPVGKHNIKGSYSNCYSNGVQTWERVVTFPDNADAFEKKHRDSKLINFKETK